MVLMPSIFTKIISGDIPAHFVWRDSVCVAFMDVRPLNDGHVLVVPRIETDHWLSLDEHTVSHLTLVAHKIAQAQKRCFESDRIGLMIAGFEIPHVHVHVVPISGMEHLDFKQANAAATPDILTMHADLIKTHLDTA